MAGAVCVEGGGDGAVGMRTFIPWRRGSFAECDPLSEDTGGRGGCAEGVEAKMGSTKNWFP
jgi:hypothetical protein